jgi:PAS domain S-box-containing protein
MIALSLAAAAAIFAFDLLQPLGVAGGVPYVALVLLGLWSPWRPHILLLAAAGSGLTVLGFLLSPPGGVPWVALANRGLALFAIWTVAILAFHRWRAEDSLRYSQGRLRAIVDNVVDGIIVIDDRGIIESVNPAAERLFGYAPGELVGRNVSLLMPEPHRRAHHDYLASYLATGRAKVIGIGRELMGQRQDGTSFPIELAVSELPQGDRRRFTGIVRDITERKRAEQELKTLNAELQQRVEERTAKFENSNEALAEEITERKRTEAALRESEARFKAILDHSPAAIYLRELRGRYLVVNRRFDEWYVNAPQGARGKEARELFSGEIAAVVAELDRRVVGSRDTIELEVEVPLGDGTPRTFMATRFPILDDQGEVRAIGGIDTDVTERKRLAAELLREQRLATLGRLNATVSHELRNPLGTMRNSLAVVRKALPEVDPVVERSLERLDRSITRCDRIIDELLDFTRVREIEARPTVVDEWLRRLLDEQSIPDQVSLRRELACPGVEIAVDRDRLRRAVINVLDNARQAIESANGDGDRNGAGAITVATRIDDRRLEISCRDSGPGMAESVLAKVFEPLFSTKNFGIGLGLAVVKQIMEQHGGGIEIDSAQETGTQALMWLPLDGSGGGGGA